MKNVWSQRNTFVKDYIPENVSIVDFGCGNKEILDFCSPLEYLGVDLVDDADLKLDLNMPIELDKIFDVGLLLGVLEYVDNPDFTLSNIKKFAKKFIILSLAVRQKQEWKREFTEYSIDQLLKLHFDNVQHFKHDNNRYIVSIGYSR